MEVSITTLDGTIEAFLLSCQVKGCSRLTVRTYDETLRRFRAAIDGEVQSLTLLRVQRYFSTLQAAGLKQITVHKHYRAIRRFLAWCVEAPNCSSTPATAFSHEASEDISPCA